MYAKKRCNGILGVSLSLLFFEGGGNEAPVRPEAKKIEKRV